MPFDWTSFVVSFGGGALGAAIGGNPAFIFTGVAVLIGVGIAAAGGGDGFLTHIAFGPVFGPHISFSAGAAAVAYARWRRYRWPDRPAESPDALVHGKDLGSLLMGLSRPDVLVVGGLFGLFGYTANALLVSLGWAAWTDTIATIVVLSGVVARLLFGTTGVFGKVPNPTGRRFRPDNNHCWLRWQEGPGQLAIIGLGMGLLSGYGALLIGEANGGAVLGFGLAATSILFLQMGYKGPVTHHIALPAAIAALLTSSVLAAAIVGVLAAFVGEACSRLYLIHGDTYVDPPAGAIAVMTLLLRSAAAAGLVSATPLL